MNVLYDMMDQWDAFQQGLGALSNEERSALKEYFDELIEDHEVGSKFFGTKYEFELCLDELEDSIKE